MRKTPEAVSPPVIDPGHWDEHEGFRETFLAWFTHPRHNAALREIGITFSALIHEVEPVLYHPPEGDLVHRLRATVAELRYLQGYLRTLEHYNAASAEDEALCRLAKRQTGHLRKVADALEEALPAVEGKKAKKTKKAGKKGSR